MKNKESAHPHFFAEYDKRRAKFSLRQLRKVDGRLSSRAKSFVLEWAVQHLDELNENWNLIGSNQQHKIIEPLE